MKQPINDSSGFTLIELLVVLLVMSVVSIAIANFIAGWLSISSIQQTKANLLLSAEGALDKIGTDIMLSGSVDATNRWPDANGPGGNQYGWTSGSQILVLAKTAVDSSNNPIFIDSPSDYHTQKDDDIYFLSGTTLYRRILASTTSGDSAVTTCPPASATQSCPADNTVATGVTSFSVTYYDANNNVVTPANARSIQLSITVTQASGTQPLSASYSERMVFRNV